MAGKPSCKELEQRILELEKAAERHAVQNSSEKYRKIQHASQNNGR